MISHCASKWKAAAAAVTLTFVASAEAATLAIPAPATGFANFGRVGGVVVTLDSSALSTSAAANWGGTASAPQNGTTYSVDSFTVIKNNAAGGVSLTGSVYVGVYSTYTGSGATGAYGEFLGVSAAVPWSTFGIGSAVTWNFSGVQVTAAPGATLVFAFQSTTDSLTGLSPISLTTDNSISIQRMANPPTTSTLIDQGAAIIEGGSTSGTSNQLRTDRVPYLNVGLSAVPEPSVMLLGAIGSLGLLRRRRVD